MTQNGSLPFTRLKLTHYNNVAIFMMELIYYNSTMRNNFISQFDTMKVSKFVLWRHHEKDLYRFLR